MADVRVSLETINKGALERRFQELLAQVNASMDDKDLIGKKRVITLSIEITPDDDEFVKIETSAGLKTPKKTDVGTGWRTEDGGFGCKEFGNDNRQVEFPSNVTSIANNN